MDQKIEDQVRKKMNAAFEKIPGLKFQIRSGRYDDLTASFKVTVTDHVSDRPLAEVQAEKNFKTYAAVYGLKPSDLGKQFVFKGKDTRWSASSPREASSPSQLRISRRALLADTASKA